MLRWNITSNVRTLLIKDLQNVKFVMKGGSVYKNEMH